MIKLSWTQALAIVGCILTTTSAGTFTVTRIAYDNLVSSLRLQVEVLDRRLSEVLSDVETRRQVASNENSPALHQGGQAPSTIDFKVEFLKPKNLQDVLQFTEVAYNVSPSPPLGYHAVLLVRDSIGQYWSWGTSQNGRHPRIQIGLAGDGGREFEIGVLITKKMVPLGRPTMERPDGAYQSIIVRRR